MLIEKEQTSETSFQLEYSNDTFVRMKKCFFLSVGFHRFLENRIMKINSKLDKDFLQ
jgi:hypothetical protein